MKGVWDYGLQTGRRLGGPQLGDPTVGWIVNVPYDGWLWRWVVNNANLRYEEVSAAGPYTWDQAAAWLTLLVGPR